MESADVCVKFGVMIVESMANVIDGSMSTVRVPRENIGKSGTYVVAAQVRLFPVATLLSGNATICWRNGSNARARTVTAAPSETRYLYVYE